MNKVAVASSNHQKSKLPVVVVAEGFWVEELRVKIGRKSCFGVTQCRKIVKAPPPPPPLEIFRELGT